jgi:hypothetical protein
VPYFEIFDIVIKTLGIGLTLTIKPVNMSLTRDLIDMISLYKVINNVFVCLIEFKT